MGFIRTIMPAPLSLDTTSVDINGIQCWDEGTDEMLGRWNHQCVRTILCKWEDRQALAKYLLGNAGYTGGLAWINDPQSHPAYPWMYAVEFHTPSGPDGGVGPTRVSGGMIGYTWARNRITYKALDFSGKETGEESIDYSGQILSLPKGGQAVFRWSSDGKDVIGDDNPPLLITTETICRVVHNVIRVPTDVIESLIDTVNGAVFMGRAAGKLRYCGCHTERHWGGDGSRLYTLSHKFEYRSIEWNKFFRKETGQWEFVSYAMGDHLPFLPDGDYTRLGIPSAGNTGIGGISGLNGASASPMVVDLPTA